MREYLSFDLSGNAVDIILRIGPERNIMSCHNITCHKADHIDWIVLEKMICLYNSRSKSLYPPLWMTFMCFSSVDWENIRISM